MMKVATIIVAAVLLFLPMVAIANVPAPDKQNQYFVALEKLSELPRNIQGSDNIPLRGYDDIIICQNKKKYIVIALPDDSEMLGLLRWRNGEVLNLYPAGVVNWSGDWPVSYALALASWQGEESARQWLNAFEGPAPRRFTWWSNSTDERTVISEDWCEEYATLLINGRVYYAVGRWNPILTSVEELSATLAVL